MSLAQQVQTINDGLFDRTFPPDYLVQVLDNGTHRVVNWQRVRAAVSTLRDMDWCNVDPQWDFFLDTDRYPMGQQLDLRPDEVETFQNLVANLLNETREGMRILTSVQPEISLTDVSVVVSTRDLQTLSDAMSHIRRTVEIASIDDAITISSIQPGSLEIILTAGKVSLYGLQLAILLSKVLKDPRTIERVRTLRRLWQRVRPDDDVSQETATETVHEEAIDNFWQNADESLKVAVEGVHKSLPEAKNKINAAAKEIVEKSDQVHAEWQLPPAVVSGLPGGITVSLNYEDPESIGRVIRAIAAPPSDHETDE